MMKTNKNYVFCVLLTLIISCKNKEVQKKDEIPDFEGKVIEVKNKLNFDTSLV